MVLFKKKSVVDILKLQTDSSCHNGFNYFLSMYDFMTVHVTIYVHITTTLAKRKTSPFPVKKLLKISMKIQKAFGGL